MKRETPFSLNELRSKLTNAHNRLTLIGVAKRLSAHIEVLERELAVAVEALKGVTHGDGPMDAARALARIGAKADEVCNG